MTNTKALEVAYAINKESYSLVKLFPEEAQAHAVIIQAAIDEATADLRTQLAERDAQLAAERAMVDRLAVALSYKLQHCKCQR